MTESHSINIYEHDPASLESEAERLRSFDIPTQTSIEAIGNLEPDMVVLDIGVGENPGLNEYVQAEGATYIATDIRHSPLIEQSEMGAYAVEGDARNLPFAENSVDIAHARFVLAHFNHQDRDKIARNALDSVEPGGKAIFIDYDWNAIKGSDAMNELRNFTLANMRVFDAGFGSKSASELTSYFDNEVSVEEVRTRSPHLFDYEPVLGLRKITLESLRMSEASDKLLVQANSIFDKLQEEAVSDDPPGFLMPDIVAVVATKSEASR